MKKIIFTLTGLIVAATLFAQAPTKMSYQAVIRDASNILVTSANVGMQISILQGSISGASVYTETHSPNTNVNGLVSLDIGSGTVFSGDFSTINWANGPYFVKTETDPTGATNYTITGTSQLLSVPYALHAKTADNITNDLVDDADADPTNEIELPTTANTNEMLMWNGSEWVAGDVCSLFSFFYADSDGDGFGNPFNTVFACGQPVGFVIDNTDCDDSNINSYPGATEVCDGIDNNCDGQIDEGTSMITQYIDNDGDGFGDYTDSGSQACVLQNGFSLDNSDCDDQNSFIYPGAVESCDAIDNNCNGSVDEGFDVDGDGYTACNGDCDDNDPNVNPAAPEACDGLDNNCDGTVDESPGICGSGFVCQNGSCITANTYYFDQDGDGFGDPYTSIVAGSAPLNYVINNSDCDDNDIDTYPGAVEICGNGIDNDCDGTIDNGC
tara:strand:- start:8032 stop:9354 length:1323 start_codon:yes stop_codon:yes gene_type:complete